MTAVNSLIERLIPFIDRSKIGDVALHNIVEEHIEMEKEQIINAFGVGCQVESTRLIGYQDIAEKYYNETYKSE